MTSSRCKGFKPHPPHQQRKASCNNVAVWQVVEQYSPAKNSYKWPRQELNVEQSIAAERKTEILDEKGSETTVLKES
jgi:hypothetical protein